MDFPPPLLSQGQRKGNPEAVQGAGLGKAGKGVLILSWDNRSILGPGHSCLSPRSLLISGFISINE